MENLYVDRLVVVCEDWIKSETTAGRSYEGIALVDMMEFNGVDEIDSFKVYLNYSGILNKLLEIVSDCYD